MERMGWTEDELGDTTADTIDELQDKWRAEAEAKRIAERRKDGR